MNREKVRLISSLSFILLFCFSAVSQNREIILTVYGIDSLCHPSVLAGATVTNTDLGGVVTDFEGKATINIPFSIGSNSVDFTVSYNGYFPKNITIPIRAAGFASGIIKRNVMLTTDNLQEFRVRFHVDGVNQYNERTELEGASISIKYNLPDHGLIENLLIYTNSSGDAETQVACRLVLGFSVTINGGPKYINKSFSANPLNSFYCIELEDKSRDVTGKINYRTKNLNHDSQDRYCVNDLEGIISDGTSNLTESDDLGNFSFSGEIGDRYLVKSEGFREARVLLTEDNYENMDLCLARVNYGNLNLKKMNSSQEEATKIAHCLAIKQLQKASEEVLKIWNIDNRGERKEAWNNNELLTKWFGRTANIGHIRIIRKRITGMSERVRKDLKIKFKGNKGICKRNPGKVAITRPGIENKKILVCKESFFTNSKESAASIIVHELAHLQIGVQNVICGKSHCGTYNRDDAERLASNNRTKARLNARNYDYYVEDVSKGIEAIYEYCR